MSKRVDDLIQSVCGSAEHPLAPFLRAWGGRSRPFLIFTEAHAAKIRKKARLAPSAGELHDLLAELALAAFVLHDRHFSVVYEPHHPAGQRGPDFQVTFKTHTSFLVEVTRPRPTGSPGDARGADVPKLARVLCDKIGQCPPGTANLLTVFLPPGGERGGLVPDAVRWLDRQPPVGSVREFLRRRQRLSGVMLCSLEAGGQLSDVTFWHNPQARYPLLPEIVRSLSRAAP